MPKIIVSMNHQGIRAYGFIRSSLLDLLGRSESSNKRSSKFTFDQLIQATLLDVIDRGNVSIISEGDAVGLKLVKEDGLSSFEKDCLNLAFSGKKEETLSNLFADYKVSDSLYRRAKVSDEKRIQAKGRQLKSSFEEVLNQMQEGVRKRISFWGLPDYYRPLTGGEKALQVGMGVLTILPLFIGFGLFLYSLDVYGYLYLLLPITWFLGLVLAVFYYWKLRLDNRDGVLNEAGAEVYYLWTSFENMLREIARLDQAELESIVVWNRLLVYATLFGYADKVSHLMKVHHIQVENPDINLYVAYGWHSMFLSFKCANEPLCQRRKHSKYLFRIFWKWKFWRWLLWRRRRWQYRCLLKRTAIY